jgi:hypothetical protein
MVDSHRLDFRTLGRHMSRERYQRGSLKKVGKTRRMWRGRWHVYVEGPDGAEKICKREKILGPVSKLTKAQAQEKLDGHIKATTTQPSPHLPPDCTFAELWTRYAALKAASWSTATRKAVTSVFAASSKRPDHPSVLALIGPRRVRELTREPLQELLNRLAARGDSYSVVKKARTYVAAALEFARDERLITDNAARKLELPTQRLRTPCERYYSLQDLAAFRQSETRSGRAPHATERRGRPSAHCGKGVGPRFAILGMERDRLAPRQ